MPKPSVVQSHREVGELQLMVHVHLEGGELELVVCVHLEVGELLPMELGDDASGSGSILEGLARAVPLRTYSPFHSVHGE